MRTIILGVLVASFVRKSKDIILPWGKPVLSPEGRGEYALVDYTENSLMVKHGRTKKIFGRGNTADLIKGPETIIANPHEDDRLYLLTEEGFLVSLTDMAQESESSTIINATASVVKDLGNGRPLGGSFASNGKTLYFADSVLGLARIHDVHDRRSKVEIVASVVVDEETGQRSKLLFVDDLCIGPKTQKVYFTDASEIRPEAIGRNTPDVLYSSKIDLIRGIPTGRLLEYDPDTDQVRVLATGFHFANGIAVDKDETYLVFSESCGPRILKYHLDGSGGKQPGEVEVVVDRSNMMGYPDGMDCNHKTGKCYAVLPSSITPLHKLLMSLPLFVDEWMRYLLMALPRQLAPPPRKFGGLLEVDPKTFEFRYILDPTGVDIAMICGVTVNNNVLYLGSLENTFIGVYDLIG